MRSTSVEVYRCLNAESAQPVDFIEIRLAAAGVTYTKRFTNAGRSVSLMGHTFTPIALSRGNVRDELITRGGTGQPLQVIVSNVDGQLATLLNKVRIDGAEAQFWTTDRTLLGLSPEPEPLLMASGVIRNVSLSGNQGSFEIENVASVIERLQIPRRLHQRKCNYKFGSQSCGVDRTVSPNTIDTTVLSGSQRSYVHIAASVLDLIPVKLDRDGLPIPKDPSDFWAEGTIYVLSGENAATWRPFALYQLAGSNHRVWVKYPFAYDFVAGDDIRIVRSCRHTKEDCFDRQGDYLPYGGFEEISPKVAADPLRVS